MNIKLSLQEIELLLAALEQLPWPESIHPGIIELTDRLRFARTFAETDLLARIHVAIFKEHQP